MKSGQVYKVNWFSVLSRGGIQVGLGKAGFVEGHWDLVEVW